MDELCGRPLKFGDLEQIQELDKMAVKEGMIKFRAMVYAEGSFELEVEAKDDEEAEILMKQELEDMSTSDKLDSVEFELGAVERIV